MNNLQTVFRRFALIFLFGQSIVDQAVDSIAFTCSSFDCSATCSPQYCQISSLWFLSRSAILLLCCLCSFWVMNFSHLYLYLCKKRFVGNARLTLKKMAKSNASICPILSISWLKSRILIMSITILIIVCHKSNGYILSLQFTGEIIEFLTASQMYLEELWSPKEMWTTAKYILISWTI